MILSEFVKLSKEEAIAYYKEHKYRKCDGYFDAKVRGSVNRELKGCLTEFFELSYEEMIAIEEEIDKELGRK